MKKQDLLVRFWEGEIGASIKRRGLRRRIQEIGDFKEILGSCTVNLQKHLNFSHKISTRHKNMVCFLFLRKVSHLIFSGVPRHIVVGV